MDRYARRRGRAERSERFTPISKPDATRQSALEILFGDECQGAVGIVRYHALALGLGGHTAGRPARR